MQEELHNGEAEEEMEMRTAYNTIDRLEGPGLGAPDIKKLKEAGFMTIQAVMMCSRRKLALIKGFSDAKVEKVYDAASKVDSDLLAFHTAADLQARRDSIIVRVTTGCDELNDILGVSATALIDATERGDPGDDLGGGELWAP